AWFNCSPTCSRPAGAPETGGGGWIRTNVGARPTDLQSAPFSRSGTPPAEPEIILSFPMLGQENSTVANMRCEGAHGLQSAAASEPGSLRIVGGRQVFQQHAETACTPGDVNRMRIKGKRRVRHDF